ncbi:MAG: peptide ABC transporter substrate-binding protein [Candidatus Andersenbacteria bacterium]|nr:peptide ABC transporter substrate-binding protein [Candidatus Andersenbacteria bacterium]
MERKSLSQFRYKLRAPHWLADLIIAMTAAERVAIGLLALALIISGIISLTRYIQQRTELIPQSGGTYREAAVGQPRYLNPILANANDLDVDITSLVYSGLFRHTSSFELTGDLAAAVEASGDQKVYTIRLRDDVIWHDGERLTADDVVFTIRSIQTPDYGSPLAATFRDVAVDKVDDTTIRFTLTEPYAPFLHNLTVGIVPEHVWAAIEPQNAPLAEQMLKPVGSGPFQFAELATRRKTGDITALRLIRNERYYGPPPYLDEIDFTFHLSHEDALVALTAGKADGVGFLPLQLLDRAAGSGRSVHRLLLPQYFGLFFNQQKNEALRESGVRAALALVTDRPRIVAEALQGQGEPLHIPLPPRTDAEQAALAVPGPNVEAAKQNLDESGWQDRDGDGIREKNGRKLSLTITTTDWPEYVRTAQLIQEQWQAIGADVNLQHLNAGTIQQTVIQPRDYDVLFFGQILPAEPDPYPFWHSSQTQARSPGLNLALFKDETVDALLKDARQQADPAARQEKLREFQNRILDLAPAVILYRPYYLFATARQVRGIDARYAALPAGRFHNIEQWHVNTQRIWRK